jgi:GMP synthase (glutamine-hydrolysing)
MCFYSTLLLTKKVHITAVSALDGDVLWKHPEKIMADVDGVIFGGSGEFHFPGNSDLQQKRLHIRAIRNVHSLVKYLLYHDIPTLGICFGHQLLSHILGTTVVRDPEQAKKAGTYPVRLTDAGKKDVIFQDIPEKFFAQYGHLDSLSNLPQDTVLLAKNGRRCRISAFRYGNNVYGVQFHPEMTKKDLLFRLKISNAEYASEKKIHIQETELARKILLNFVSQKVVKTKRKKYKEF